MPEQEENNAKSKRKEKELLERNENKQERRSVEQSREEEKNISNGENKQQNHIMKKN